MGKPLTVGGYIASPRLSRRLQRLCANRHWRIVAWHNHDTPADLMLGQLSHVDVLFCDSASSVASLLETHARGYVARDLFCPLVVMVGPSQDSTENQTPMTARQALHISAQLSDGEIAHTITTALNVDRFEHSFAHAQSTDPVSKCSHNEDLIQFANRYRGRPLGLLTVHIDHADHLYAGLDSVAKTDILSTFAKFLREHTPPDANVGLVNEGCFSIWLPNCEASEVAACAKQVQSAAPSSLTLNDNPLHLTTTIAFSHTAALFDPELAWYALQKSVANTARSTSNKVIAVAEHTAPDMRPQLPEAIVQDDFALAVQPQWDISGRTITGVEALLRWQGLDVGDLSLPLTPAHFVPIAERSGQMARVGDWVLERICREAATWTETITTPITIAVNVSVQQFHNGAILEQVNRLKVSHWLDPSRLELELNHTSLLRAVDDYRDIVFALRDLGVTFAIDNLGLDLVDTELLLRCPADTLKIDRSVVAQITSTGNSRAAFVLAEQISQLALDFNLRCVAVGVEDEQQRLALERMGCSEVQGYLFCEPVSTQQFRSLFGSIRGISAGKPD